MAWGKKGAHARIQNAGVTAGAGSHGASTRGAAEASRRWSRKLVGAAVAACVVAGTIPVVAGLAAANDPAYGWYTVDPSATTFTLNSSRDWRGFVELVNGTADTNGDGSHTSADAPAQTFAGKTVVLGNSLNFLSAAVKPAGGQGASSFDGTLDGNGKTIDNVVIDAFDGVQNVGLIGRAGEPSLIKDVTVGAGVRLSLAQDAEGAAIANVGLLAGSSAGNLQGCTSKGSLTVESAAAQTAELYFPVLNVGGVVGICTGDVTACANEGAISISETSAPRTENEQNNIVANVGGVVGSAGAVDTTVDKNAENVHGMVSSCANTGSVHIETPSEGGKDRFGNLMYAQSTNVGGVAGYSRSTILNCTNSAVLDASHASSIAGVVGAVRAKTTSTGYSGNFSDEGSDDGVKDDVLSVSGCTNTGVVKGWAFAAGIVGRAGSYCNISGCVNGQGAWVAALRSTKPFPSGIVGGTYGDVTYCANLGTVIAAQKFQYNESSHTANYTTSGGYYASGIAGNTAYFTDKNALRITPLPEVYGCYNAGSVHARDGMRQRALVGDNAGYVHDNLALTGCVSSQRLVYGDHGDDHETSGGTVKGNSFVSLGALKGTEFVDEQAGTTVVGLLNAPADVTAWSTYWVHVGDEVNNGYPALNTQVHIDATDISQATVALASDAPYTSLTSVPRATVVAADGTPLVQNVDFKVVPQAGAVEITPGSRPYAATIEGIGHYRGVALMKLSYGIGKGDLADCSVTVDAKTYNGAAQMPAADSVHVRTLSGAEVDPSEYTVALAPDDPNLTDGKAVNARKYGVIVTASSTSPHFTGSNNTGTFNIKRAQIICPSGPNSTGNFARPDGVEYLGESYSWFSMSQHPNATDSELTVFPYTGYPIKPDVTGVTLTGTTVDGSVKLKEGVDYRVVYGRTVIDGDSPVHSDNVGKEGGVGYGYIMVRYVIGGDSSSNYGNYDLMKFLISDTGESADLSKAEVKGTQDIIFEPEAQAYEPISVWYGGSELVRDVDYTIVYQNNDAPGQARYTVTAKEGSRFTGSLSGTFNIVEGTPYTLTYAFDEAAKTATVTGLDYLGGLDSFKLDIPAAVEKDGVPYAVTAIADKAFGSSNSADISDDEKRIGEVTIPASVRSIGDYAFCLSDLNGSSLSRLTCVTFADGSRLESIGANAFRLSAIEDVTIPSRVRTVGDRAFAECGKLKKVVFESASPGRPDLHKDAFKGVNDVAATAFESAAGVATYVNDTIKAQNWKLTRIPDPVFPEKWTRLSGPTALDTMARIGAEGFPGHVDTVVVAAADGYWDALAASPLAGAKGAPVLLTATDGLSECTASEIDRLGATKAYICGGEFSVSNTVKQQLEAKGLTVTRLAGAGAAATAVAIANELGDAAPKSCIIATAGTFQDALAASPYAYWSKTPVFLANAQTGLLDEETVSAIKQAGFTSAVIAGGEYWISGGVLEQLASAGVPSEAVERRSGATAYETSASLAAWSLGQGMTVDGMAVATGETYYDALTGAALCGKLGSVLVLASEGNTSVIDDIVADHAKIIRHGYIFGGPFSVAQSVQDLLEQTIAGRWFTVTLVKADGTRVEKNYSKAEFEALKSDSTTPQSGMYYKSSVWNVTTAASYVTLKDLFSNAGVSDSWSPGATLSYEGRGGKDQSYTYDQVMTGKFFPNAEADVSDATGAVDVVPCLMLTGSSSIVKTTAADAQAANVAAASSEGAPMMLFGVDADDFAAKNSSGMRYWRGLKAITIMAPRA